MGDLHGGAAIREKAISLVKDAVQQDQDGNYEAALKLYRQSLEHFQVYLKYEKNPRMQETIKVGGGRRCKLDPSLKAPPGFQS